MNLRKFLKIATFADKILFITLIILFLSGILYINKLFNHANYAKIEVDGKLEYILIENQNENKNNIDIVPFILLVGTLTGMFNGILSEYILQSLKNYEEKSKNS
ncbi:MAG: hypothetical protein HXY53_06665 [Nitrospirae bacterium]|nr:hypothetical protein [Nitrospirota bacterium]